MDKCHVCHFNFCFQQLVKTSFASVDLNKDGNIDYEEFRKFYEIRSQSPSTTKVEIVSFLHLPIPIHGYYYELNTILNSVQG